MTNDMRQMQHDSCMLIILYNFVHRPFIEFLSEPSAARRKIPVLRTLDQTWHYSILTCCTRTKEFAVLLEQACPWEQSSKDSSLWALLPAPRVSPLPKILGVLGIVMPWPQNGWIQQWDRESHRQVHCHCWGKMHPKKLTQCPRLHSAGAMLKKQEGLGAPMSGGSGAEGTMWAQRHVVLSYNALEGNSVWVSFLRANILLSNQMVNSIGKSSFDGICICKQNFIFNLFWDEPTNVCWYPLRSHSLRAQKIEEPFVHHFK